MNQKKLESLLLGARTMPKKHSAFTQTVMQEIRASATFDKLIRTTSKQPKWSLRMKLRTLHGSGLAAAILITLVLLSGAVYASVRFAPDFIQLLNKKTNEQGRVEYTVPSFAQCQNDSETKIDTFAVRPTANLSDDEVKKILQAKCELDSIDTFARNEWPTRGQHTQWQDGDTIYYARPDVFGTVQSISGTGLEITYDGGQAPTKRYSTFQGQKLEAFNRNKQTDIQNIHPGDLVFVIERIAETYHTNVVGATPDSHSVGIIAVVKMTLPKDYYGAKQNNVYEVTACLNNPGETCPKEQQASIDVFPRGSEGATNPYLRQDTSATETREINGVVTTISPDQLTLKSNKGNTFTLHVSRQIIDGYNTNAAPLYTQNGKFTADAVSIHVGSWISITYQQQPNDNPRDILLSDIFKAYLLTDLGSK